MVAAIVGSQVNKNGSLLFLKFINYFKLNLV